MEELDKCLELRRKITDLEEKISDIDDRIRFPKAQTISDMPRCSSFGENKIDQYLIQKEKYQNKKLLYETELSMLWNSIEKWLICCGIGQAERYLMYLRFNSGFSWKKCTAIMRNIEGQKWNENKVFRTYRGILKKLNSTICEK